MRHGPLLSIVIFAATSCTDPAQLRHDNTMHREIQRFEFKAPLHQIWRHARQVLAEDGFVVDEREAIVGRTVASDLRRTGSGDEDGYRALLHISRISFSRYLVRIQLQYQHRSGEQIVRSIEPSNVVGRPTDRLMWTLIERVEPRRAARILRRVNQQEDG